MPVCSLLDSHWLLKRVYQPLCICVSEIFIGSFTDLFVPPNRKHLFLSIICVLYYETYEMKETYTEIVFNCRKLIVVQLP